MLRKNEYHPEQYPEYLANHFRHNMMVNILDMSIYMFGMSMVSGAVILPAFLKRLGACDVVIGLLPAIAMLGMTLPQAIMSFFAEASLRHKPWCMLIGIPQRVPWLAMGVLTLLFAETRAWLLVSIFLVCYFITHLSYGLVAPSHGELIGKAIPPHRRGIFMGLGTMSTNGLGILGGLFVKFVMESGHFNYPHTYAVLFFAASVLLWVSYIFFAMNREPILWPTRPEKDLPSYLRSLLRILRTDHHYRRFIVSRLLATSKVMGVGFFMVHGLERFELSDAIAGNFVMVSAAATLLGGPALGFLGDRVGHKFNQALGHGLYVGSAVMAILAWNWRVMYVVFALMAMVMVAQMVSNHNLIYQFSPEGRRPTYLALAGTLSAPFILGFSLLGGWLAGYSGFGYHAPFAVSIVLNLVSLGILIFAVRVPDIPAIPSDPFKTGKTL